MNTPAISRHPMAAACAGLEAARTSLCALKDRMKR